MKRIECQQVITNVLKTQIQFGVYRVGDRLPIMEDACRLFFVSITTVRAAYKALQKEDLVTISKNVGVKVKVDYSDQEIERNIQSFFASHRCALTDLSRSMQLLFSGAQLQGFKNVSPELLDTMEQFVYQEKVHPSYRMLRHLRQVYGSLNNDLLMRLVWQVFMFYQVPFLSVVDNPFLSKPEDSPLLHMINLCREHKWVQLQKAEEAFQTDFAAALGRFFESRIPMPLPEPQADFLWSSYKKASQICYSLGMELMSSISRGVYPAGSYLPSAGKLARTKKVSVSTVRRTLAVLNGIGVTKSINGMGTQVLSLDEITENCDLSQPTVRRRLLDFAQSLQILALSCKEVTQVTMTSIDAAAAGQFKERLRLLEQVQRAGLAAYGILELVTHFAPYQAVRTVYTELFRQLLWGYPLRSICGEPELLESYYRPCLDALIGCLDRSDAAGFASKLEEILLHELDTSVELLVKLGIQEAADLTLT